MGEKTFEQHMDEAGRKPFLGHPLLPIPLLQDTARTERVSAYVELPLLRFYESYRVRMGARSISEVIRRLSILGAQREGYVFNKEPSVP